MSASKPEEIPGTNGAPMVYARALAAASEVATYTVKVTLTDAGQTRVREAALTAANR